MGYLTEQGEFDPVTLKKAMAYGIVVASYTVEEFSLDRLKKLTRDEIESRLKQYARMLSF